ncbi:sulfatase family protein [Niabella aurantiaca]|uniref:sulfatase family protein n=1 Tax=Niabella aurantiaca TaxID=379900 RepID=UPI000375F6C9|nr:sulfatase [Niabella aurantiaca]
MKRSCFLLLSLFFFIKAAAQQKPNFIIIYADDLGYGDIGINGHPGIQTPNLDQMAIEGIRFSNYYSASPACTASRYALLTGKYPSRAGFRWVLSPNATRGIHSKEQTMAELLKDDGYQTAIFGKWHLGSSNRSFLPLANGFDEYVGLPYSNDMIPPKYPPIALLNGYDTITVNPDQSTLTRIYTEKATAFIKRNRERPFFVYLPYAMPHTPLFASARFRGSSKRGKFGDVVQELDFYIGRLISCLKEEGLNKNTYVIFTSDNGPWVKQNQAGGSAGLFRDGKGSTWEGGMREPFILWGHHSIPRGKVVSEVFTALDIFPTIATLAGKARPKNRIDGHPYADLWKGVGTGRAEFYYVGIEHQLMAVRKGPWKLHIKTYSQLGIDYFEKGKPLLFNLDEDPSEKYDLASKYPDRVKELSLLIRKKDEEIKQTGSFWDQ